ncbi:MAG: hypothetical protein QM811_27455 [Pirellulales bacterium]
MVETTARPLGRKTVRELRKERVDRPNMFQHQAANEQVELGSERERLVKIVLQEANPLCARLTSGFVQHSGREIDRSHIRAGRGQRQGMPTGATTDVQHA